MAKKHNKNNRSKRSILAICLVLYSAALIVRIVYLVQIQALPTFKIPVMDEGYHIQLAERINSPDGLPDEPYFRAPLYPYLLSLFLDITGGSLFWTRFIQVLIGSFLPVLIFLLGKKLFSTKIALVSAIITVCYPTFIYYDSSLLITSSMVLLSAGVVLLLYRAEERPTLINFVITGLLLGISGLARPNILLLGPALLIWIWFIIKPKIGVRKAILYYLLMGGAAFLMILPVTIRNYAVSGELVFISWQGGANFYLGNNIDASGWSATAPGIDPSWSGGYNEMIAIARESGGRNLKLTGVSDFWYRKAFDDIFSAPGNYIRLLIKKIRLLINGYEIHNNQHIYLAGWFAPIIKPLLFTRYIYFPFGMIAPFSIIGIILSVKQRRKFALLYLFLGAYSISLLLFFICARFRQPLIPFLILFAVYGAFKLAELFKSKNYKTVIPMILILVLLFIESNHFMLNISPQRIEAEEQYFAGSGYLSQFKAEYGPQSPIPENNTPQSITFAIEHLKKAAEADPTFAMSFNDLGTIEMRRGRYDEARRYLDKAIEAKPLTSQPYLNYSTVLRRSNDYKAAINILERAIKLFPYDPAVNLDLGLAYYQIGEFSRARGALLECLRLNPGENRARILLDQIERLKGTRKDDK
jgi:tetratricopeptide (TPR) repeat protein